MIQTFGHSLKPLILKGELKVISQKYYDTYLVRRLSLVCFHYVGHILQVMSALSMNNNVKQFPFDILGWFSNRTGTSVDDGARKSNNWLDQLQSGKLSTGSRV